MSPDQGSLEMFALTFALGRRCPAVLQGPSDWSPDGGVDGPRKIPDEIRVGRSSARASGRARRRGRLPAPAKMQNPPRPRSAPARRSAIAWWPVMGNSLGGAIRGSAVGEGVVVTLRSGGAGSGLLSNSKARIGIGGSSGEAGSGGGASGPGGTPSAGVSSVSGSATTIGGDEVGRRGRRLATPTDESWSG